MSAGKTKDGGKPAIIAPLPWEVQDADAVPTAEDTLFDILGSDPDFQDEEDLKDADGLESGQDSDDADEPDETDDDDPEDEDEDDLEDGDDEDIEEDEDDKDEDALEDEDSDEDETRPVKVDGKIIAEVTFDEAVAGYSRQADYTRKRQADIAEQATVMVEVGEVRDRYTSHLEQLQAVMESMTSAEGPDDTLRESDPGEYAAQKQDYNDRLAAIAKVAEEKQRVVNEKKKESDATQAVYLEGEMNKLIAAVPGWDNEAVRATEVGALQTFATETYGFTTEELGNVVDHRLLLLLIENKKNREKADEGRKEIRKKSKGAKKLKPGSGRGRKVKRSGKARKANQAARERLAQSGSVQDASTAILGLLGDDD